MTDLRGWQYMLAKFHMHGNVLTTMDMIADLHVAAEYRRIICNLKDKGFNIQSEKVTQKCWRYRLIPVVQERDRQMRWAI